MSLTVDTSSTLGVHLCTVTGPIELDDMVTYAAALLSPTEERPKRVIWDLRGAQFNLTAAQVKTLVAAVSDVAEDIKPLTGFVVTEDTNYGLVRMFQAYRDKEDRIRVFRDYNKAIDWITQP